MMTTEQFLNTLEQSNLIASSAMSKIRRRVEEVPQVDARRCAKGLVDKGWITAWQARQLLGGRSAFFLGKYRLLDRLGRGGMGMVFKAQHALMDRTVALKVMAHFLLKNPRAVARFNREVKTAAALNHPNIITAYDADAVGNTHFLVMEYVEGQDLNQWLKNHGPLPVAAACECALQAAEGLNHAFRQGMVHRDIKPVNLVVTWNAQTDRPLVKILDMGLARFVSEAREAGGVTRAGQTIGTPDYIAPEAAQNFKKADIRADIFSLGCTLYKLLTGRLPFSGENTMEKLLSRTTTDAPPIRQIRADVPEGLEAALSKMLARDPHDRFQTPAEVLAALAPFAASNTGDAEAVAAFRELAKSPRSATSERVEADPDSSLDEFLADFSNSPQREESSSEGQTTISESLRFSMQDAGGELELAPDDDLPAASAPLPSAARKPAATPAPVAAPPAKPGASSAPGARPAPPVPATAAPALVEAVAIGELDDNLFDRPMATAAAALGSGGSADPWAEVSQAERPRRRAKRATWDSYLFLGGGGLLLLLLIAAPVLWFIIGREGGDAAFHRAEDAYRAGSYGQSIEFFSAFLADYPRHPSADIARAELSAAKLWQTVESGGDWNENFKVAEDTIAAASKEPEFEKVRAELAAVLPKIAEGLAQQAEKQRSAELIERGRQALAMIEEQVPKAQRPAARLDAVRSSLLLTEQRMRRDAVLAETLSGIEKALAEGNAASAYDLRRAAIKQYADLETDEKLLEAIRKVGQSQLAAVKIIEEPRPPQALTAGSAIAALPIADRAGEEAPGVTGSVVTALAGEALFGLDATHGQPLWRVFIGDNGGRFPVPVDGSPGADLLVLDAHRGALARLNAKSGAPRWRQPIDAIPLCEPLILGQQVLLATDIGNLEMVDLTSGERAAAWAFPQRLAAGPASDAQGQTLYQLAEHSNLYVLKRGQKACAEVFYLGHAAGSIGTSPVVFNSVASATPFFYVLVCENRGLHDGVLRVLLANQHGLDLKQVQELPLEGHVNRPPTIEGRMLYVFTDRGAMYSYEIGTPEQPAPLVSVVRYPAESNEHVPRFALVRRNQVWVADGQLTQFVMQAARGTLEAKSRTNRGDHFVQPLVPVADVLFHVRRAQGRSGVTAAALNLADGSAYWETELGLVPATAPIVAGADRVVLPTENFSLFAWSGQQLQSAEGISAALARVTPPQGAAPPWHMIPTSSGVLCWSGSAPDRLGLLNAQGDVSVQWLTMPSPLACPPAALADKILVPTRTGQVLLLDSSGNRTEVEPFQPPLSGGSEMVWLEPAARGENAFVVAERQGRVYAVGTEMAPHPHFAEVGRADLTGPLAHAPAVAGDCVYVVDGVGSVVPLIGKELTAGQVMPLDAPVAWGPVSVGQNVLCATQKNELHCFDGAGQRAWTVGLPAGPLVGTPVVEGNHALVASAGGVVARIALSSGAVEATVDLEQPLAAGPAVWQGNLLGVATDGTLLRASQPK